MLETEKATLIAELKTVGRINPDNSNDWEPVLGESNINPAEIEERASEISQFEDQSAIEFTLETRLNEVLVALRAIEENTFGTCAECGNDIEEDRLKANPAAKTCKAHMNNDK